MHFASLMLWRIPNYISVINNTYATLLVCSLSVLHNTLSVHDPLQAP